MSVGIYVMKILLISSQKALWYFNGDAGIVMPKGNAGESEKWRKLHGMQLLFHNNVSHNFLYKTNTSVQLLCHTKQIFYTGRIFW